MISGAYLNRISDFTLFSLKDFFSGLSIVANQSVGDRYVLAIEVSSKKKFSICLLMTLNSSLFAFLSLEQRKKNIVSYKDKCNDRY